MGMKDKYEQVAEQIIYGVAYDLLIDDLAAYLREQFPKNVDEGMIYPVQGCNIIIDREDLDIVSAITWHINWSQIRRGEGVYCIGQKRTEGKRITLSLHRVVMGCVNGDGKTVDHINGNTLDCRKSNLRICTTAQNISNQKKAKNNTSGYKGATWVERDKKYRSSICVNKKRIYLGMYSTKEEAHAAYCEASKKYHKDFGRTE